MKRLDQINNSKTVHIRTPYGTFTYEVDESGRTVRRLGVTDRRSAAINGTAAERCERCGGEMVGGCSRQCRACGWRLGCGE